jgi:mannose/fructose/N-acetylgalactosamine-specific phosphotransferase system component IIC
VDRGKLQPLYLVLALIIGIAVLGAILLIIQQSQKTKRPAKRPGDKDTEDQSGIKDGKL